MSTDTRTDSRTAVSVKVRFKSTTLDQFIERYSVDISRGGMFIRTREPLAVGTAVRFEFTLDDSSPVLSGEATVVWRREHDPQRPGAPAGMGVKFDALTPESRTILERILEAKKRLDTGQAIGASQPIAIPSSNLMDEDDELHRQPTKIAPLSELMGDAADDALSPNDRTVVAPAKSAELARRTLDGGAPPPELAAVPPSATRPTAPMPRVPTTPPPIPAYDRAVTPDLPLDVAHTGSDEVATTAAPMNTPAPHLSPPPSHAPPAFAPPIPSSSGSGAPQRAHPGASQHGGYGGASQPGQYPGASQHGQHPGASQHAYDPGASQHGGYPGASQHGQHPVAAHVGAPELGPYGSHHPGATMGGGASASSQGQDGARATAGFGSSSEPFAHGTGPGTPLDRMAVLAPPRRLGLVLGLLGGAALITGGIVLVVHGGRADPKPLLSASKPAAATDDELPVPVEPVRPHVPRTGPVDVEVVTHPEGAQLHIDGQPFDQPTPTILRGLDPKKTVKLVAVHECYEPAALEVTPDPSRPVEIALKPRAYALTVTSTPPGAVVRVEGRELGPAPQEFQLGPGDLDHPLLVTVSRAGFREKSVSFDPRPSCKEGGGKIHVTLKR